VARMPRREATAVQPVESRNLRANYPQKTIETSRSSKLKGRRCVDAGLSFFLEVQ
jgi:hypothetical protein